MNFILVFVNAYKPIRDIFVSYAPTAPIERIKNSYCTIYIMPPVKKKYL